MSKSNKPNPKQNQTERKHAAKKPETSKKSTNWKELLRSDEKSKVVTTAVATSDPDVGSEKLKAVLMMGKSMGNGAKGNVYRTRCANTQIQVTSAANTALTTVTSMFPNTATDAITLSSVFDESRTTHVEIYVRFDSTTTATGVPAGPSLLGTGMIVYDPANSSVYGAVSGGIDALMRVGPISLRSGASPAASGERDFWYKKWKVPTAIVDPGLVTDLLGSNWVSSKDNAVLIGYLKPYVEPMGAGTSSVITYFIVYSMEFRVRG